MVVFRFLFIFIFIYGGGLLAFRHSFYDLDKELYNNIVLKGNDLSVKADYLKKFGKLISKQGVFIYSQNNIKIMETFLCGKDAFQYGDEFFFQGKTVCSKGVFFFLNKNSFKLKKIKTNYQLFGNLKMIDSKNSVLIYDSSQKFKEGETGQGIIVKKDSYGIYRDFLNTPLSPDFIFHQNRWQQVLLQKEFFILTITENNNFKLELFSRLDLPYKLKKLKKMLALKAFNIKINTKNPGLLILSGEKISGIKIPGFLFDKKDKKNIGKYKIIINFRQKRKSKDLLVKKKNFLITFKQNQLKIVFKLDILSNNITKKNILFINAFLKKHLPSYLKFEKREKND